MPFICELCGKEATINIVNKETSLNISKENPEDWNIIDEKIICQNFLCKKCTKDTTNTSLNTI